MENNEKQNTMQIPNKKELGVNICNYEQRMISRGFDDLETNLLLRGK